MASSAVSHAAELESNMGENNRMENVPTTLVEYARARHAVERYRDAIKSLPGVTGFSIGPRFRNDKLTSEVTIRLHVPTEGAKHYLRRNAETLGLRKHYEGVGTDIVAWRFRTASGGAANPVDGDRIHGDNGFGTLGTTVVANLIKDQLPVVVWTTAAHVVSKDRPQNSVDITKDGQVIGKAAPEHYFKDAEIDFAYIKPGPGFHLKTPPPGRNIRVLNDADVGKAVSMHGAASLNSAGGVIISIHGNGTLEDTNDAFTNHILVQHPTATFAIKQDSGAMVRIGNEFIGVLRAVGTGADKRVAVISKLSVVRDKLEDKDLGFRLS
jgi:hypothetical protein